MHAWASSTLAILIDQVSKLTIYALMASSFGIKLMLFRVCIYNNSGGGGPKVFSMWPSRWVLFYHDYHNYWCPILNSLHQYLNFTKTNRSLPVFVRYDFGRNTFHFLYLLIIGCLICEDVNWLYKLQQYDYLH